MLTTKKRDVSFSVWLPTILVLVLLGGCSPPGPRAVLEGDRLMRKGKFDQAITRLEAGARLLPKKARVWNHLGLAYHHGGRPNDAIQAYRQALALDRDLAAARYNLGSLFLEQGNASAAMVELTTYTVLQPKACAGWLRLGMAQLRARQIEAAEKSFRQAQKLNPTAPEALNGLGLARVQQRRYPEAARHFSAALGQQPDYAPALLNLAIISHQYLGDRGFALQKYREYGVLKPPPPDRAEVEEAAARLEAELSPPATNAASQLARTLNQLESPSTNPSQTTGPTSKPLAVRAPAPSVIPSRSSSLAAPALATSPPPRTPVATPPPAERAGAANPAVPAGIAAASTPSLQKIEVVQLQEDELIKAVRDVTSAGPSGSKTDVAESRHRITGVRPSPVAATPARSDPSDISKAGSFSSVSVPADAREAKLSPESTATLAALSRRRTEPVLRPEERTPLGTYDAGPASRPATSDVHVPRYTYRSPAPPKPGDRGAAERWVADGFRAQERGRLSDAVEAYRKATRTDPSFFEAHYNLGVAAFEAGDLDQALPAYEFALAVNPLSAKGRYNFAVALQRANFWRDAANELEKLLAENPSEARAHFTLATLYAQQLGAPRQARAHYLQLLELAPNHPQATAIRFWLEANP